MARRRITIYLSKGAELRLASEVNISAFISDVIERFDTLVEGNVAMARKIHKLEFEISEMKKWYGDTPEDREAHGYQ